MDVPSPFAVIAKVPLNGPGKQIEFADSSWPLFSMYQKMTGEEDNKMAERWQKDAEGIIIFTGLFSAAVAALVAVTVPDLKPNSQETSAFYLKKMYELQVLVDSNAPRTSIPSTPAQPDPFSPPKYAIWVNLLWFLSLVISLTCAMVATLMQQWARRYLRITQQRSGCEPHHQARLRAFFAEGVDKLRFSWVVDLLTTLIHISLFLFLAGLLIYLCNINHTVYMAIVPPAAVATSVYLFVTLVPLFRCDSPYYTSLSSITGLLRRMEYLADKTVRKQARRIDVLVLMWISNAAFEDSQLAQFFESLPGFLRSSQVGPVVRFGNRAKKQLSLALKHFWERTWSSHSIPSSDKTWRLALCVKVADIVRLPGAASSILEDIFPLDRHEVLQSVEMGEFLRTRGSTTHQKIGLCAQSIVAGIITNMQRDNVRWIGLSADQLGISKIVLQYYLDNGDSVLLANLIHITRQIHSSIGDDRDMADALLYVLSSLSNFNIQNTLPGLQQDFLTLWDEIDQEAQNNGVSAKIRDSLRDLYNALNPGTHDTLTTQPVIPVQYYPRPLMEY